MLQRDWECSVQPQAGAAKEEQDLSSLIRIPLQNDEYGVPLPEEDFKPKGPSWLYHSDAIRTYLSLMDQSKKDATLEACAGALQNLTASRGLVRTSLPSTYVHPNVSALPRNQKVSRVGKTSKITDHHHISAMEKENVLLKPQGTTASLSTVFDPVGCSLTPNSRSPGRATISIAKIYPRSIHWVSKFPQSVGRTAGIGTIPQGSSEGEPRCAPIARCDERQEEC